MQEHGKKSTEEERRLDAEMRSRLARIAQGSDDAILAKDLNGIIPKG
jgi:hypothetical protein